MPLFALAIGSAALMAQAPASRAIPPADWDLTALYPNADAAAADRVAIERNLLMLAALKGKLADPVAVRSALQARSALRMRLARYYMWANLRQSHDGSDEAAGADMAAVGDLSAKLDTVAAFIEPELVALGDARLAELARTSSLTLCKNGSSIPWRTLQSVLWSARRIRSRAAGLIAFARARTLGALPFMSAASCDERCPVRDRA